MAAARQGRTLSAPLTAAAEFAEDSAAEDAAAAPSPPGRERRTLNHKHGGGDGSPSATAPAASGRAVLRSNSRSGPAAPAASPPETSQVRRGSGLARLTMSSGCSFQLPPRLGAVSTCHLVWVCWCTTSHFETWPIMAHLRTRQRVVGCALAQNAPGRCSALPHDNQRRGAAPILSVFVRSCSILKQVLPESRPMPDPAIVS